jgi:hypothetical protein
LHPTTIAQMFMVFHDCTCEVGGRFIFILKNILFIHTKIIVIFLYCSILSEEIACQWMQLKAGSFVSSFPLLPCRRPLRAVPFGA